MNNNLEANKKQNLAKEPVLSIENLTIKVKRTISQLVLEGKDREYIRKELEKIIGEEYLKLLKIDKFIAEETFKTMSKSSASWYFSFENSLSKFKETGNVNEIAVLQYKSEQLESRDYLTSQRFGYGQIKINDYEAKVREAISQLAESPPVSNRLRADGTPYKISLRNLAEMKVRADANKESLGKLKDKGTKLIIVSTHVDASERCQPWQGRVYSLDGTSGSIDGRKYIPLEVATDEGLFGYNCRHRPVEYLKGMMMPDRFNKKEIDKERAIDTRQRQYESAIRKAKTKYELYRGVDKDLAARYRSRSVELNKRYQKFSESNDRPYYPWRTQIKTEEK